MCKQLIFVIAIGLRSVFRPRSSTELGDLLARKNLSLSSTFPATVTGTALLLTILTGCAVSPEVEERRRAADAEIEEILSLSVDQHGDSLAQDCLGKRDSRYLGALGGYHIVFVTRDGQLWVNTLRSRCMDLEIEPDAPIAIHSSSSTRSCRSDLFYPDCRKAPPPCLLGEFVPVSADQLAEIQAALERKHR